MGSASKAPSVAEQVPPGGEVLLFSPPRRAMRPPSLQRQEEAERPTAAKGPSGQALPAPVPPPYIHVPIQTLAPEPYRLLREMTAVVQREEDGHYTAFFFDANIGSSGDTQAEAVSNLKSILLDVFDDLEEENPSRLSTGTKRQLSVLREFIERV